MPGIERTHNCYYSIGKFLTLIEEEWLKKMKRHAAQPPTAGQIKAWVDSFRVLQAACSLLPDEYRNLYIVFEYALPRYPVRPGRHPSPYYVYADAVLLSKNRAVVLEFKQKDHDYFGDAHQARKYHRRIQNFHNASRGMGKGAVLVLTKAKDLREHYFKVDCCSADLLHDVILEQFPVNFMRHPDPSGWCSSAFSARV